MAPVSSSSAPGWQDADIWRIANGEVPSMAKRIRAKKEGYFNVQRDTAFTPGTATYRIVSRAMADTIALVQGVAPDGGVFQLEKWKERDLSGLVPTTQGIPRAYLWRSNSLVFYPTPDSASYSYRLTYPRRVSRLVSVSPVTVGIVSSKTSTTVTLTTSAPSLFNTSSPLDFIRKSPPWDSLADDKTPTIVASNVLTFAAGVIPSELAAGDFVCLAEEAPVLQMPTDAFYVLAQRTAMKLVASDKGLWAELNAELQQLESDFYGSLADRDPDEPDHVACEVWP